MYKEEQENLEKLRVSSPLKIAEIILAEGYEPLTNGPSSLVASLPWEQLREPAFPSSRLSLREVYIAKLFEISIYVFEDIGGGGIPGMSWSFFAESSTKFEGSQKDVGSYRIPRQLADQVKQDFGLTTPETTIINNWTSGIVQVDIPTLNINGDEKISNWKKFLSALPQRLSPDLITGV
jgi:hypothetical protein